MLWVCQALPLLDKPKAAELLPPFALHFQYARVRMFGMLGVGTLTSAVLDGDARLLWGDLSLRADHIVCDREKGVIEGSGNVVLVRGDETVRGSAITIFLATGDFVVQKGTVISLPYRIYGERVEQVRGVLTATRGVLTPDPEGKGELRLFARKIEFVEGRYTELTDVRIYLYGKRILTLKHYRLDQQAIGKERAAVPRLPIEFKISRISGFAIGLDNTWTLIRNGTGTARVYLPTKNGPQYLLSADYNLLGGAGNAPPFLRRRGRDSLFNQALEGNDASSAATPAVSPLRHLLTMRPSPGPDPVLDFQPLLETSDTVGDPLNQSPRYAALSATLSGKEEIGVKRQGNLLLARRPEIRVISTLPLNATNPNNGEEFETNDALRHYLRSPRLALNTDLSSGTYHEDRLTVSGDQNVPDGVNERRTGGQVGVNLLPLLLGSHILFQGHVSYRQFQYSDSSTYRVPEVGAAASYILDRRTWFGAALYRREPSGDTPFFFDQIDTRSEAQAIAQGRVTSRVTVAALARYDLDQSRLFDYGVMVGVRGTSLEPRVGYRKLGSQFTFGFSLVGL